MVGFAHGAKLVDHLKFDGRDISFQTFKKAFLIYLFALLPHVLDLHSRCIMYV